MPKPYILQIVGHKLLLDEMFGIVVTVLITVAVAQISHQFCRSIAQMQRNRQISCLLYELERAVYGIVG